MVMRYPITRKQLADDSDDDEDWDEDDDSDDEDWDEDAEDDES